MAWHHLSITDSHLVYALLGGFTTLFMLCSSFIKERMYIGEATVATLAGVIFGPHCANLIDPNSWGSTDIVTIEFSRIVLVVQCFAVGVELPKYYMEKHWRSVVYLLVPVMTFGWLITSLFIWWMIVPFDWLDSLVVAACVTATDPVLASSVVGKGKFAKRVPKHLRDLLSAESGCNDGMAFPFVYLSVYLIQFNRNASDVSFHFVVYVILYECVFGAVYGFIIGYIARHGIRYAERHDMIDRESFLVFYFVVALFCAGTGSILGLDDLLVGFAAGVGFSNDGWFLEKTEESHVSNVIDLLLNLTYFVYLGTIIPWEQYNSGVEGLYVWHLVVIAVFVIFFRRIPIMLALKPLIPDLRTWREALFAGHFGPIGVGAIFVSILARAELEHGEAVPLAVPPDPNAAEYKLIYLLWPIVTFMVISSIIVHGSSIAVFTLGKRINTLSLTMSYTAAPDDGPSWMNRLPRISSTSRSQAKLSGGSMENEPEFPADTLAPPGGFLRRRKEDDDSRLGSRASSLASRRRKSRKSDAGGPISQSAIYPSREGSGMMSPTSPERALSPAAEIPTGGNDLSDATAIDSFQERRARMPEDGHEAFQPRQRPRQIQVYEEGHEMVFEDQDGEVLSVQPSGRDEGEERDDNELPAPVTQTPSRPWTLGNIKRSISTYYTTEMEKRKSKEASSRRHEPARAYQFGNTIIVEDEDGEVVKTYQIPAEKAEGQSDRLNASLKYVGLGGLASRPQPASTATDADAGESSTAAEGRPAARGWTSFLGTGKTPAAEEPGNPMDDDSKIRFTIGGEGRRMTKEDFIREVQKLDASTRKQVVEDSNASRKLKALARQDPALVPPIVEHQPSDEEQAKGSSSSSTANKVTPSDDNVETAVERRRRLSVLASQEDDDEYGETPAERRRRQAALGTTEDDSDEEGASAVQNTRIRFAEPERGRRR